MELSYVAKSVSYDDDCAMALVVVRKKDNPIPIEFWYSFALNIAPAQRVSMTFQRRGRGFAGMSLLIDPAAESPAMAFPNIVTYTDSTTTLNMLQAHIHSDTIQLYDKGGQTECIQIPAGGVQREIFRAVYIGRYEDRLWQGGYK